MWKTKYIYKFWKTINIKKKRIGQVDFIEKKKKKRETNDIKKNKKKESTNNNSDCYLWLAYFLF